MSLTFGVLSFLELQTLRDIGAGQTFDQKKTTRVTLASQPVAMFKCATRPRAILGDYRGTNIGGNDKFNMTETSATTAAMRGDYAINAGSQATNQIYRGPATLAEGDSASYAWPDVSDHTGISYQRSLVSTAQISDGMSKTLLLGEKYVNPTRYTDGWDFSENSNLYTGYENDNHRATANPPQQDRRDLTLGDVFGSAHPSVFGMAMCDGSLRFASFTVDPAVWLAVGGRSDGMSNVYLIGEKFVPADQYRTGTDEGDQSVLYAGYSSSNVRFGYEPPLSDADRGSHPNAFGSPHRGGWTVAFGDGSVRTMSFDIQPALHKALSSRDDGALAIPPQ